MTADLDDLADHLTFLAPLSETRAAELVGFLTAGATGKDPAPGTVLDLGCGWGELLLRVLDAAPSAGGVGVDSDERFIARARRAAGDRGLVRRADFLAGDARTSGPDRADAVLCIGASQIWGPPVEAAEPVAYAEALAALRARVDRGARVVYGEGIWSRPPTPEAAAPLSGRLDEMVSLPELVELAVAAGFASVAVAEAGPDEWDAFESGFAARWATWLAGHGTDHPDAADVLARAARQRQGYYSGYRGVLGFAYLSLLAI